MIRRPRTSPLFPSTTLSRSVSASVKARLEREYGPAVWVLDPGAYQMPPVGGRSPGGIRSEEHTSELQSRSDLVCRLLLEKKKTTVNELRVVVAHLWHVAPDI